MLSFELIKCSNKFFSINVCVNYSGSLRPQTVESRVLLSYIKDIKIQMISFVLNVPNSRDINGVKGPNTYMTIPQKYFDPAYTIIRRKNQTSSSLLYFKMHVCPH